MKIIVSILFIFSGLHAEEVASPTTRLHNFLTEDFFDPDSASKTTNVEKELSCIQYQTKNKAELIKTPQATQMIKRLSPYLQDGFDRFKLNSWERAFFYSQSLEESGAFTMLSERKKMQVVGENPMANLIVNTTEDQAYIEKKGTKVSRELSSSRGRGLIQITGCDSFLATNNYLNGFYKGKDPEWSLSWKINDNGKDIPIEKTCDGLKDKIINRFPDRNLNLFGSFKDPSRFAMIGGELEDPLSRKKIDSEKFMVDSSLAFFRGKCGKTAKIVQNKQALDAYPYCNRFANPDHFIHAVRCLTYCIRGTDEGWERRVEWMKKAFICAQF